MAAPKRFTRTDTSESVQAQYDIKDHFPELSVQECLGMKVPRKVLKSHMEQSAGRLQAFQTNLKAHLGDMTHQLLKNMKDEERVESIMKSRLTVIPTEEYLEKARLVNLAMEAVSKVTQKSALRRGPTMESVLSLDKIMLANSSDEVSYMDADGSSPGGSALINVYCADYSKLYMYAGDFPSARTDGHLVGYFWKKEFRALAFGGMGSGVVTDLHMFSSRTKDWKKMLPMPGPRIGSTSCRYKDKIYVFGGAKTNISSILSAYYEDVLIYDIKEETWSTIKGNEKEKGYTFRRFKDGCCTLMNDKILLSGGKSWEGDYLTDMQTFTVPQNSWGSISEFYDRGTEYLKAGYSNHAALFIPKDDLPAKRNSEVPHGEVAPQTMLFGSPIPGGRLSKYDVLLMYGGRNSKSILPGNLIRMLHTSGRVHLTLLTVNGVGPGPRHGHTLSFIKRFNLMVLMGGYGGSVAQEELESTGCLYLVYLTNNLPLSWIKVTPRLKDPNTKFLARYGHSAIEVDNKIIIFGGLSHKEYVDVAIEELEIYKRRKHGNDSTDRNLETEPGQRNPQVAYNLYGAPAKQESRVAEPVALLRLQTSANVVETPSPGSLSPSRKHVTNFLPLPKKKANNFAPAPVPDPVSPGKSDIAVSPKKQGVFFSQ